MGGVVGERELEEGDPTQYRPQQVAFALAKRILDANFNTVDDKRPWLFPQLVEMCRDVDRAEGASSTGGYSLGLPDDDHRGAGRSPPRRCGTRSCGRTATAASACAR